MNETNKESSVESNVESKTDLTALILSALPMDYESSVREILWRMPLLRCARNKGRVRRECERLVRAGQLYRRKRLNRRVVYGRDPEEEELESINRCVVYRP